MGEKESRKRLRNVGCFGPNKARDYSPQAGSNMQDSSGCQNRAIFTFLAIKPVLGKVLLNVGAKSYLKTQTPLARGTPSV